MLQGKGKGKVTLSREGKIKVTTSREGKRKLQGKGKTKADFGAGAPRAREGGQRAGGEAPLSFFSHVVFTFPEQR